MRWSSQCRAGSRAATAGQSERESVVSSSARYCRLHGVRPTGQELASVWKVTRQCGPDRLHQSAATNQEAKAHLLALQSGTVQRVA